MLLQDPDESPVYLFLDPEQAIYHRDWVTPTGWMAFDLEINCRNTVEIAKASGKIFGNYEECLGVQGPNPQLIRVRTIEEALDVSQRIVGNLLSSEGLSPDQCAVLGSPRFADCLRERMVADSLFVPIGKRGVVAESIHRFKGLEADAVVVSLADIELDRAGRSLVYIGFSRARTLLFVLATEAQEQAIDWGRTASAKA